MPGTARFPARRSTSTTSWKKGRPIRLHPAPPPVAVRARCDDRGMTVTPVSLSQALATFSDVYSPRIIGRVNDYDIRIAHVRGEHLWHVHDHTDEFFLVLLPTRPDGSLWCHGRVVNAGWQTGWGRLMHAADCRGWVPITPPPRVDAAGWMCEPLGTMSAQRWRCCR